MRGIIFALVFLSLLMGGCTSWDRFARTNADWANEREMQACVSASGGLEPYGYGHLVFGTGGAEVATCARIFGLPGAANLPRDE